MIELGHVGIRVSSASPRPGLHLDATSATTHAAWSPDSGSPLEVIRQGSSFVRLDPSGYSEGRTQFCPHNRSFFTTIFIRHLSSCEVAKKPNGITAHAGKRVKYG